jgi:hypothetical protein
MCPVWIRSPAGTGKYIPSNDPYTGGPSFLQAQVHYTATGVQETDESEIGLYYYNGTPLNTLVTGSIPQPSLSIPPNSSDVVFTFEKALSSDKQVRLYDFDPHMHIRGKSFKYEAIYPNGTTEVLLNVPKYDFNWQNNYRLANGGKLLPANTKIRATAVYDNSVLNRQLMEFYYSGLNDEGYTPDRTVGWGEQSWDEMFIGYLNYVVDPK